MTAAPDGKAVVRFIGESDICMSACKALEETGAALFIGSDEEDEIRRALGGFIAERRVPKAVYVRGAGLFALGADIAEALENGYLFTGVPAPDKPTEKKPSGRAAGRIAIVTGAAQGFGRGIAEGLAGEGAYVIAADRNYEKAKEVSLELNRRYGACRSLAVGADVSDEESVKGMISSALQSYGGLDLFVSCAGIVRAGGLDELSTGDFDEITRVNYRGYYLCAKYASEVMKLENRVSPGYMTDIIEINSKSGLDGSKKNFAYAGSKFGGIGLTQSFALELCGYGIKVNAVCPGNYLDGPLWSDPERGLFVQYLRAGKVPGAKTVADVRRYYESKVPLGRGCQPKDVLRAILYIMEQEYETGQAVPVTGGQSMLN